MRKSALQVVMLGMSALVFVACVSDQAQQKNRAAAIRNVGEAYMYQGQYTAALRELLRALEIYPDDPFLHNDLGLVYMAKQSLEAAEKHFATALEINPEYAPARNNLGTVYLAQEKWDKAITCFETIVGNLLYATPHYPLANIGWAYFSKKQYDQAVRYYREALTLQPRYPTALRGLGRTYLELGEIDDAVHYLEAAIHTDPRFYEAFFELAGAYIKLKRPDLALAAYKRVVAIAPPESDLARQSRIAIAKLAPNSK